MVCGLTAQSCRSSSKGVEIKGENTKKLNNEGSKEGNEQKRASNE